MYFHHDNDLMGCIEDFGKSVAYAAQEGRRVRIDVDDKGRLRYKIGDGMWSAPISSTPDPYRDLRVERPMVLPI
jgi:hypothetical protein